MEVKALLEKISGVVSLTGYEYMAEPDMKKIIDEDFKACLTKFILIKPGVAALLKKA